MAYFGVCFSLGKDNTVKKVQDFLQALNAVLWKLKKWPAIAV